MNQQPTTSAALDEFQKTLESYAADYGISLSAEHISRLNRYYQLVHEWNPRLHLVAPCTAHEFALRHILESLLPTNFITDEGTIIDVGTGAGLPGLPCLILKPSLRATLIEASPKKTIFLRECVNRLSLSERTTILNVRFEKSEPIPADALTCRALDRFTELLPELLNWAHLVPTLLLFGGPAIQAQLERTVTPFSKILIPHSEQRSIFLIKR